MKPHIFDKNPRQPAVVMIGSSKEASAARENLAEQIAKIYSMKCNDTRPVQVQGENLSSLNPGDAKKKIDTDIHAAFSGGACAAIVSNFEKLPPSATTVFYQFCENDAAPYKDVIILFTTEIRTWEWLGDNQAELLADGGPKPKFWSRAVEDYIQHSLMTRDNTGKMTVDMIGGLLTRITPLVAWVRDQG